MNIIDREFRGVDGKLKDSWRSFDENARGGYV